MKFGIRKKIFFITLGVSIVISFVIGFFIYRQAYRLFLENFLNEKLALARCIADALDGDELASFTTPEALSDETYRYYQRYLHDIKNDNEDVSYLYAIVYDRRRGHHVYTLDANINETHTLWVETDLFALICRFNDGSFLIEHEQKTYTDDFTLEIEDNTVQVRFEREAGAGRVYLDDTILFAVTNTSPLTLDTPFGIMSESDGPADLSRKGTVRIDNEAIPLYLTLSLKGMPESIPGESYNEHDPESIEFINELLANDDDYITEEFEKTEFGESLFIYSIIHGGDRPTGVLGLEVWAREVTEYRRSILLVAGIVSVIAFVLSVTVYLLVTENMVIKAIKKFSKGVIEIARGNFSFHVNITRNDEIGDLATTFNSMADGLKERDLVKDLFGKYVQKEVAERALKSEIKLGGEKQEGTVLFSDIRSFTTISEGLDPETLVSMLNRYFTVMVDNIILCKGVLDKYIGDALMVHFGILGDADSSADNAVRAAIGMMESLHEFNSGQESLGRPEISIGVGIHTGDLVAGNIGSPNRMEYTVIGDTVNLASRAEGLTKLFGASIVITQATYAALKKPDSYLIRPLDLIVVKGKTKPVQMYEVFDADDEEKRNLKRKTGDTLQRAVALYRKMNFNEAKKIFGELTAINPEDRLLSYFSDLCDYFTENPPPEGWDGSTAMHEK
ncbi:MAG: adenylate/guanylate cyclase domain-containing protein [Spirochaetes bacterium]|nr:adenylate/guanylate cyclase domain-containing protein [Spirochaetota bacterium]